MSLIKYHIIKIIICYNPARLLALNIYLILIVGVSIKIFII